MLEMKLRYIRKEKQTDMQVLDEVIPMQTEKTKCQRKHFNVSTKSEAKKKKNPAMHYRKTFSYQFKVCSW